MAAVSIKRKRKSRQSGYIPTPTRQGSETDMAIQEYELETQWSPEVTSETDNLRRVENDQYQKYFIDFSHLIP